MKEIVINSFRRFHDVVQRYDPNRDIFRGVLSTKFSLVPKLGRKGMRFISPIPVVEKEILRLFKIYAAPYLPKHDLSDWELLAIAQHHGLPTRILDWSRNPLVAAYFAVEQDFHGDSAVYVLKGEMFVDTTKSDPFGLKEVSKFIPAHISPRIASQSGLFTVHPEPSKPFNSPSLDKLIIAQPFRRRLKNILYRYGIHRASLFPGLDGVAGHIQWLKTESH